MPGSRPPKQALIEAMNRFVPVRPETSMTWIGNVLAEATHNPELLGVLHTYAMRPRSQGVLDALCAVQERGAIRSDLDLDVIVTMCVGSSIAAYLRAGEPSDNLAARVVDMVWPAMTAGQ